jgi:hypothetical protein
MNNPEVNNASPELNTEQLSNAAAERSAELDKSLENRTERSPEQQAEVVERARAEANKEAIMSKERSGSEQKAGGEPDINAVRKVTKKEKDAEYKKTLKEIRSQMNAPSRTFSKVIHNRAIDKTSSVVGATVARPNAVIAGSTTALILVSAVYIIARTYGYPMSGFETIGAFIIGWMIGLIYDYIRVTVSVGKSS